MKKSKFAMVPPPKNVPSDEKKQVCDGTPSLKFTIREQKQVYDGTSGPETCHQIEKSKFAMVLRARNVPSDEEKQVFDGTPGPKTCHQITKTSLRWYSGPETCHQMKKSKFAMVRPA
ncbi:MAG: hypothetical protein LKG40_01120 [Lachnospiraceae bacterium]|jgi:hypothetical protein|nr:hypothetical protein [Lachnospiraceae bacterium]